MSTTQNVTANLLGRGWSTLMSFLFIPFYIKLLGIESYGLIGIYASLSAALTFLDLGMSQTLIREVARYTGGKKRGDWLRDLIRTLEWIFLVNTILFITLIWLIADWLATHWLSVEELPVNEVALSISIIAFVVGIRWISGLYRSGIIGFQQQVWLNILESVLATFRGVGVLVVLILIEPTIQAFFIYQGILALCELVILSRKLWRCLPAKRLKPRFHIKHLQKIWRFAGGVALISIQGAMISQADKFILPSMVTLKEYGYYNLASALGKSISQLVYPVAIAYRPKLTQLVANAKESLICEEYHKASQAMSVIIIPLALILAVFSQDVLWLWTGDQGIVLASSNIVTLLALGSMLNGLVTTPYSLQLAYGWLKLGITINSISLILLLPTFILGVYYYGVIAAGWVWVALNLIYILINVSLMHTRILIGEKLRWYILDVLPVIVTSLVVVFLAKIMVEESHNRYHIVFMLILVTISAYSSAIVSVKYPRNFISQLLLKIKNNGIIT